MKPQFYRHFKGNYYRLLHIALDSEEPEQKQWCVYQALYGEHKVWVRPFNMFFESVTRDGKTFPRFTEVSESDLPEEIKALLATL